MPLLAETTATVPASAEAVWAVLADVEARPRWHPRLQRAWLDGPLAPGVRGGLHPERTRPVDLEVGVVQPQRRLTLVGVHGLPVARGTYEHELRPLGDDACEVTLRMRVDGPAARLVALLAGRLLRAWAQPGPLQALGALARERDARTAPSP
ncbi:hypothetical protein GKE82_10415 [Conexibacter sp. W3-3-2]|uniref:SRPBCC family protein n=1 Tax=Paraconexibacter algicola TaxID=2133960 RepID=A0A2T4UGQ4_9ACTN|nr:MULTISPECIES: SRPBCC family protein [Solirubrobacterales]MTD44691.1 hypothetical protein [Conexibacter sp. W3-3-2]PTL58431.1 hypothetical protein C7Y72_01570 [Paraconexibacter algicola]